VQDSCSVVTDQPLIHNEDYFAPDQLMCRLLDVEWQPDNKARIYFRSGIVHDFKTDLEEQEGKSYEADGPALVADVKTEEIKAEPDIVEQHEYFPTNDIKSEPYEDEGSVSTNNEVKDLEDPGVGGGKGDYMAQKSAGMVYNPDYWVDKETFYSMRKGLTQCKCPRCPKVFKRLHGLVKHWQKQRCQSLSGPVLWEEIKDVATGQKRFTCAVQGCPDVGKTWKSKVTFQAHMAKKHDDKCIKTVECDECDEKFLSKSLLTNHKLQKHEGDGNKKTFACSLCGRVLNKRQSLIAHERSHTGERPFKCEYCEQRFITKQSLSRHIMNRHAAETGLPVAVHVCELCGKEFKSKKNLKEHRYYHADNQDNRQQCEICHKVLKQKNSYMKHMVNVHKKGFECDLCQKTIATEDGLKLHKRDQHGVSIQVL